MAALAGASQLPAASATEGDGKAQDAAPPPATTQLRPSSSSQKVEGVGSPKWDLRHTSAPPRTTSQDDGCTAFCSGSFSTAGGSVLLGQTKDTPSEAGRYRVMRVSTMLLLLLLLLLRYLLLLLLRKT